MILKLFVGSYTEYLLPDFGGKGQGIYSVRLNTETGELKVIESEKVRNPSYLTVSSDNKYLYCITELDESENPQVKAYKINSDLTLEFLNQQPISGGYPCHINTFKNSILVACYVTGNVIQYPLDDEGKLLETTRNIYHRGSSVNKERQEGPHAHQIVVHPNNEDIYVCDLGLDSIKGYNSIDGLLTPNEKKDCSITKGSGPRHMVFNKEGSKAYVINELTGTLSVLEHAKGVFRERATYPTLPENYKGVVSGSSIRLHPNGKFLYVGNRGIEAITIFMIVGSDLKLLGLQLTGGKEMREFNITPDGKWLIACHQNSHDTVVYSLQVDGTLKEVYRTRDVLSPVCVVFANSA